MKGTNRELGKDGEDGTLWKRDDWRPSWKQLEPHGRLQGAIDLQGKMWSKPSKSGGTTRAGDVQHVAVLDRREAFFGKRLGTGHMMLISVEGRSLDKPKRGNLEANTG